MKEHFTLAELYEDTHRYRWHMISVAFFLFVLHLLFCSYVFDCEGPSGEAMLLEKHVENEQNKEALDRVRAGSDDPKDREKAENFINDNMAWR